MDILHISDLHLTGENQTFAQIWLGPRGHLDGQLFDFVIISGDLSQAGATDEYKALLAFLDADIVPLLRIKDRARIIVVPGNHDVSWTADIGAERSVASYAATPSFVKTFKQAQRHPSRGWLRWTVTEQGHLQLFDLDEKRYNDRFKAVATEFFEPFYEGQLNAPHRAMALTASDREHWSAHVFADQKVAFYGFSSCFRNDKLYHGAHISPEAVLAAAKHASTHAKGFLRVAVWHHGLTGERGRPDYLTFADLGMLHSAGFRVGFHGHTHKGAWELIDRFFGEKFALVSTGSLGAGAEERPDSIGNQFSIVRLFPGQLDVQLYQSHNDAGFRVERHQRIYSLADIPKPADLLRCVSHVRETAVGVDGIATATVRISGLQGSGTLPLALARGAFCRIHAEAADTTLKKNVVVDRKDLEDGAVRFSVQASGGEALTWKYHVSNAVALDRSDLSNYPVRSSGLACLSPFEEARPHTVRFPTNHLKLSLSFPGPGFIDSNVAARVIVERPADEHGAETWIEVDEEAKRCALVSDGTSVTLTVEAPIEGFRYTPAITLARPGRARSPDAAAMCDALIGSCRDEKLFDDGLVRHLSTCLPPELMTEELGSDLAGIEWIGLVWDQPRKNLVPVFGNFTYPSWRAKFSYGAGIAGHAFRFDRAAGWHRATASRDSLIFYDMAFKSAYGPQNVELEWIVCFPIRDLSGDAPLGVFSFAGFSKKSAAEQCFAQIAEDIRGNPERAEKNLEQLVVNMNALFWNAAAGAKTLPGNQRGYAERVLAAYKAGNAAPQ